MTAQSSGGTMMARQSRKASAPSKRPTKESRQDAPVLYITVEQQAVEVVVCSKIAVAYVIQSPSTQVMELVKLVFAMAPDSWRNDMRLVNEWGVWAVICSPEWGAFMRGKPRPTGVKLAIIG